MSNQRRRRNDPFLCNFSGRRSSPQSGVRGDSPWNCKLLKDHAGLHTNSDGNRWWGDDGIFLRVSGKDVFDADPHGPGYVYLIENLRWLGEIRKIGSSGLPARRCKDLQTYSPYPYIVVGAWAVPDMLSAEDWLHDHFSHLNKDFGGGREWYEVTKDEVDLAMKIYQEEIL